MQKPKMSKKISSLCVALLLTLTSAQAARQTLNSISDIRSCVPHPTNILELLHWFANIVKIDHYGTMSVMFNPNSDYGSHHYGNYEGMLAQPSWGYKYFTIGNIHQESSTQLPSYVRNAKTGTNGRNRARIIFSATQSSGEWNIQEIYITQHSGTSYDPNHTYQITTNLLRELRGRSISEIQQGGIYSQRSNFVNTSIYQQHSYSNRHYYVPQSNPRTDEDYLLKVCMAIVLCICFCIIIVFQSIGGK